MFPLAQPASRGEVESCVGFGLRVNESGAFRTQENRSHASQEPEESS